MRRSRTRRVLGGLATSIAERMILRGGGSRAAKIDDLPLSPALRRRCGSKLALAEAEKLSSVPHTHSCAGRIDQPISDWRPVCRSACRRSRAPGSASAKRVTRIRCAPQLGDPLVGGGHGPAHHPGSARARRSGNYCPVFAIWPQRRLAAGKHESAGQFSLYPAPRTSAAVLNGTVEARPGPTFVRWPTSQLARRVIASWIALDRALTPLRASSVVSGAFCAARTSAALGGHRADARPSLRSSGYLVLARCRTGTALDAQAASLRECWLAAPRTRTP